MEWAWVWTALAIMLGIGEAVTAGFFLLPFAVGATVAAIVGWVWGSEGGVGIVAVQWLLFFVFSFIALMVTRAIMKRQDKTELPPVGANRFRDARAMVVAEINNLTGEGSVRVEEEIWRATTDGQPITTDTQVRVVEVRGTRLVVEPIE